MFRRTAFACLFLLAASSAQAAEPLLKVGDLVAIEGDSITEQKLYSVFIEDYLLMCQPEADLRTMQFGWSGETAAGFERRMENDLLRFKPNVMTTCFGMNDGGYAAMTPDRAKNYREAQTKIVERAKAAGVRAIVVGSPGVVDADAFNHNKPMAITPADYNKTLAEERDIAREVAKEQGVVFADVFTPMMDTMTKIKVKYGKQYHLAGGDGVHPAANGHLVMAYAFLKALGCSGDIGKIDVDLAADKANASAGHKVQSCKDGAVELESTRYPFCFVGDPSKPEATTGVIEFLPFNQDLNRLMLAVRGGKAEKYTVTWGKASKQFSRQQLSEGINLAAEFLENPFSKPFQSGQDQIRKQQEYETALVKNVVTRFPEFKRVIPDAAESLDRLAAEGIKRDQELAQAARASIAPVKHTLKIEAVK